MKMQTTHNFYITWGPQFKQFNFTPCIGFSWNPGSFSVFIDWLVFDYTVFFHIKKD